MNLRSMQMSNEFVVTLCIVFQANKNTTESHAALRLEEEED